MAEGSEYITLVSSDGFDFVVRRSAAYISPTLKKMLDPTNGFIESSTGVCHLENIHAIVLEKVCEYLYYNERNKDAKDVPKMELPMELSLELLIAGDYLNI